MANVFKSFYSLIFYINLGLLSSFTQYGEVYANSHPNVLLLILDDLRPSLGIYEDSLAITPNIDRLSEDATVFTQAFAQQALCGPSRTSFLTSRRPDITRLVDVHYYWRRHAGNFTSLPQYFKEHGYDAQSVGKVFHPGVVSNHNDDQPYSWSMPPFHPSSQKYKNYKVCPGFDGKLHSNIYCPVQVNQQPEKTLPDIQSTEFSLKWLHKRALKQANHSALSAKLNKGRETLGNTKPFFLAVGLHKPHIPLKFPMEFLELFPIDSVPLPPNNRVPKNFPTVAWNPWNDLRRRDDIRALNLSFPYEPIPDYYSRYIRQGYYAATSYADSLVGLIVSQTQQLFPNTIIALIGDHGWSLGEHREWSKFSNFNVATRVPFIVSMPSERSTLLEMSEESLLNLPDFKITSDYFKQYIKLQRQVKLINKHNGYVFKGKTHRYDGIVELLDLFPTLVDLSGLPTLKTCPKNSSNIKVCADGMSLSCVIMSRKNRAVENVDAVPVCPRKFAALSQYPRPGVFPTQDPDSDQPRLKETKIMGYSLRNDRYRYTAWVEFNHTTFRADFGQIVGEELYDHYYDSGETKNLAGFLTKQTKLMRKHTKFQMM